MTTLPDQVFYILQDKQIIPTHNILQWGRWFQETERHVADDKIGDIRISTVFLGIDHGFGSDRPVLFETMVFGGALDGKMARYCTYEEAEQGHCEMIQHVLEAEERDQ